MALFCVWKGDVDMLLQITRKFKSAQSNWAMVFEANYVGLGQDIMRCDTYNILWQHFYFTNQDLLKTLSKVGTNKLITTKFNYSRENLHLMQNFLWTSNDGY